MPIIIDGSGPISGISLINASVSSTELSYLDGVTSPIQNQIANAISYASSASANALTYATTGGKILQVVRATDTTNRTTTSTSYVDVTGMTVTITPQRNTSAIIVIATFVARLDNTGSANTFVDYVLTDSSNTALSGAQQGRLIMNTQTNTGTSTVLIGYSTPATTSATTYKLRFSVAATSNTTGNVRNGDQTGQMFAFEVGA